ncbi:MAG: ZIP family metal transporter [Candidatus Pacearchaeota archaeon]|nr:ZIP family metal transporter [Candidatus Pacearchaeota archaeon]
MELVWLYTIISVLIISFISLIGVITLSLKKEKLQKILIYLISFSAGALFGDAFIHLLPEAVESSGFTLQLSFSILGGILIFFVIEKFIHWQHCHHPITKEHTHSFAKMNIIGDGIHNFLDGLIIGASYLINVPVGIATTLAVAFHEIPQEIGDFGVLIHGGYTKRKALLFNFLSALTAILGAIIALIASNYTSIIEQFIVPIAIGGFIYIAGSDLIPELHKNFTIKKSIVQLISLIIGILVMAALLLFE